MPFEFITKLISFISINHVVDKMGCKYTFRVKYHVAAKWLYGTATYCKLLLQVNNKTMNSVVGIQTMNISMNLPPIYCFY